MRYTLFILSMVLGMTQLLAQQFIAFEHDTVHWTFSDDSLLLHTGDTRDAQVELLTRLGSKVHIQVEQGYIVSRKVYHKNGTLTSELNYKTGILHGVYRTWTDQGILQVSGQYVDGMESGEWNFYRRNGKRQLSGNFLADPEAQLEELEFIEHITDDDVGEYMLLTAMATHHSPPHGNWLFYDANGKVAGIIDFEKGKVRGMHFGDVE